MITSDKLGVLQSNFTTIADGVDLKQRFIGVLDNHPLTYHWSDGVKKMIALKFYDEIFKPAKMDNFADDGRGAPKLNEARKKAKEERIAGR